MRVILSHCEYSTVCGIRLVWQASIELLLERFVLLGLGQEFACKGLYIRNKWSRHPIWKIMWIRCIKILLCPFSYLFSLCFFSGSLSPIFLWWVQFNFRATWGLENTRELLWLPMKISTQCFWILIVTKNLHQCKCPWTSPSKTLFASHVHSGFIFTISWVSIFIVKCKCPVIWKAYVKIHNFVLWKSSIELSGEDLQGPKVIDYEIVRTQKIQWKLRNGQQCLVNFDEH